MLRAVLKISSGRRGASDDSDGSHAGEGPTGKPESDARDSLPPGHPETEVEDLVRRFGRKPSKKDFRKQFRIRRFAGPLAHAEQLEHLRIVHLTDLHVGRVTPMEAQLEAARIANEAKPDAVVITGDFVCHSHLYLDELTFVMNAIDAPVFAVLGNHDHWSGAKEVRWALRRAPNVELLDNAWTTITLRHQQLQVLGLDDAYTRHSDWRGASKGLRRDVATLGLSHIAEEADKLWTQGVPLVLAGHTHAGQITLAKLHELAVGKLAGHRYVHGLYGKRAPQPDDPQGAVYVGAGVGAAVVPLRVGERSRREVTIFELGHAPGSFEEPLAEQVALPGRKPSEKTKLRRRLAVEQKQQKRERRPPVVVVDDED